MRRTIGLVATLTAVGLALVACGGSARMSKAEYGKALSSSIQRVQREMKAAYGPLIPRPNSSPTHCSQTGTEVVCSGGQDATLTSARSLRAERRVQGAVGRAATELAALKPPTDVTADNEKLVAGFRALSKLYSLALAGPRGKQGEARWKAILQSADFRGLDAASRDLTKKGYKLGSLANTSSVRLTGPSTPSPPVAKSTKPLPFSVVSRAGEQAASNLAATVCGAGTGCAISMFSQSSTGPIPSGLSVVRPGERVHFVGPGVAQVSAAGTPSVSGSVKKLCAGFSLPVNGFFFGGRSWVARLKPGAYVLSLSFSWDAPQGRAAESGIVGLLVSRTQPLRVLPRPRCR